MAENMGKSGGGVPNGNKPQLQENNVKLEQILQVAQAIPTPVPWTGDTTITPGKQAKVIPAHTDKELTVKGDTRLAGSNIREGITIFETLGTLKVPKVNYGNVVYASPGGANTFSIPHGLGKVPSYYGANGYFEGLDNPYNTDIGVSISADSTNIYFSHSPFKYWGNKNIGWVAVII